VDLQREDVFAAYADGLMSVSRMCARASGSSPRARGPGLAGIARGIGNPSLP